MSLLVSSVMQVISPEHSNNIGALGTVLFLRFINPVIVSPYEMGIVEKQPPTPTKRGLMLMS